MRVFSTIVYPRVYPYLSLFLSLFSKIYIYIKSNKRAFITRPIFKLDFLENRDLGTIKISSLLYSLTVSINFRFSNSRLRLEIYKFINCRSFRNELLLSLSTFLQRYREKNRCVKVGVSLEKIRPSPVFIGRKIERVCDDKSPFPLLFDDGII